MKPDELARGEKAREPLGVAAPAARLTSSGLTRLLNPTSIWHKTISAVFHKVFQSCFAYWNRPNQLASGQQMPPSSCSPVASVNDCREVEWGPVYRLRAFDHFSTFW